MLIDPPPLFEIPKSHRDAGRKLLRSLVMQHAAIPEWEGCPGEAPRCLMTQACDCLRLARLLIMLLLMHGASASNACQASVSGKIDACRSLLMHMGLASQYALC